MSSSSKVTMVAARMNVTVPFLWADKRDGHLMIGLLGNNFGKPITPLCTVHTYQFVIEYSTLGKFDTIQSVNSHNSLRRKIVLAVIKKVPFSTRDPICVLCPFLTLLVSVCCSNDQSIISHFFLHRNLNDKTPLSIPGRLSKLSLMINKY